MNEEERPEFFGKESQQALSAHRARRAVDSIYRLRHHYPPADDKKEIGEALYKADPELLSLRRRLTSPFRNDMGTPWRDVMSTPSFLLRGAQRLVTWLRSRSAR
jgi:hypothetical protein